MSFSAVFKLKTKIGVKHSKAKCGCRLCFLLKLARTSDSMSVTLFSVMPPECC